MIRIKPGRRGREARGRRIRGRAAALAILLAGLVAALCPAIAADMAWKTVRIGMRSADSPGSAATIGFETDLAQDLCRRMAAACEIEASKGMDGVAALQARRVDALIAWLAVTPTANDAVDFSYPYATDRHGFLVAEAGPLAGLPGTGRAVSLTMTPKDAQDAITALETQFAGKRLGARAGSTDLVFLQDKFGAIASVQPYDDPVSMLADLTQGRLDAVMAPFTALRAMMRLPEADRFAISGPQFWEGSEFGAGIAVALRPSDTALRNLFDRAIAKAMTDGTLERLSVKWFGIDVTPHRCNCKPF